MKLSLRILLILAISPTFVNAQWDVARKLSTTDTSTHLNENMGRCIAASGDSVHVVWWDQASGGSAVFYRHSFDAGASWSDPVQLPGASSKADFTCIAVSGNHVHVAYREDSTSWYLRSSDAGNTWSQRASLGQYYWWPSIACSGPNVFVALNSNDPGNSEVWCRRSTDNGVTWDNAVRISNAHGRSEDPSIAAANGHVYLVWNDNRDSLNGAPIMQAYSRMSSDNGVTWGAETLLNHPPVGSYFPFISAEDSNVDFVWGDRRGMFAIYYKHSTDNGTTWSNEQLLSNAPTMTAAYPVVARSGKNVDLSFWYFTGAAIYRHSGDGGNTWDAPVTIVDSSRKPSAVFLACTNKAVHIIWEDASDGHPAVYYARHIENDTSIVRDSTHDIATDHFISPTSTVLYPPNTPIPVSVAFQNVGLSDESNVMVYVSSTNVVGDTIYRDSVRIAEWRAHSEQDVSFHPLLVSASQPYFLSAWGALSNDAVSRNDQITIRLHIGDLSNVPSITDRSEYSVYPTLASAQVNFRIPSKHEVIVDIYDDKGTMIKTIDLASQKPIWNVANVRDGLYFCRIRDEKDTSTFLSRVIVQH